MNPQSHPTMSVRKDFLRTTREQIDKVVWSTNPEQVDSKVPEAVDAILALFTAELERLKNTVSDDEYGRRDGSKGNKLERAWDSGFNGSNELWREALDATIKQIKEI